MELFPIILQNNICNREWQGDDMFQLEQQRSQVARCLV
jgi:hypothetical protein